MTTRDQDCCPTFEVEKWDGKTINWENRIFLKESITTFFHIPFPPAIGKKVMKMHNLALETGTSIPDKSEALILFRDPIVNHIKIFLL